MNMIKKIIGSALIVIGGVLIVFLLTYGGPVFPHIIGPTVAAVLGIVLVAVKGKENKSTE
jgi:hypothetical protein